jgi:acetylornithine deacetylase/succinyl-diaminopimelate desuccinylase-like protein
MDFRLPPDMNDKKQLERLRAHLDRRGFMDIEIRCLSGRGYPYKIPITEELSQVIIKAATQIFGSCPAVYGLTQEDIIRHHLGLPVVLTGFGPPDCNLHAPNENMTIEYLKKGIKYAALIMDEYGKLGK